MDKQQYQKQLDDAIQQLAVNGPDAGRAYQYLKDLSADPHGVAAQSLLRALSKPSSDLQTLAALGLGRFGRGVPGVVDALAGLALDSSRDLFVCSAALHALAQLQTSESVRRLLDIMHKIVGDPERALLFQSACSSIKVAGASITPHIPALLALTDRVAQQQMYELDSAFKAAINSASTLYGNFARDGYSQIRGDYLGKEPLSLNGTTPVGDLTVLLDQRVRYLSGYQRHEQDRHSKVHERDRHETRMVVVGKETGPLLVIAVWDFMTSFSLVNTIEYFAEGVSKAFRQTRSQQRQLSFGYFTPGTPAEPKGTFTAIKITRSDDNSLEVAWGNDKALDSWAGDSAAELRTYLSVSPQITTDLLEYLEGSIRDERMKRRFLVQQAQSPEAHLDYSSLEWDFPRQVRDVLEGRAAAPVPGKVFGDSFDQPEDVEFFGKALPDSIQELLKRCESEYLLQKSLDRSDLRHLDWPSPFDIEQELIITAQRPFELQHPRDSRQIVLDLDPRTYGAFVFRSKDDNDQYYIVTNVPATVFNCSSSFEWGYSGAGPSELALNILNFFVPPGSDNRPASQMAPCYWSRSQRSLVSDTAVRLATDFREELITPLPLFGGFIAAARIREWILRNSQQLR